MTDDLHESIMTYREDGDPKLKTSTVVMIIMGIFGVALTSFSVWAFSMSNEQRRQGEALAIVQTNQAMVMSTIPEIKDAITKNTCATNDLKTQLAIHEATTQRITEALRHTKGEQGIQGEPGPRGKNFWGK